MADNVPITAGAGTNIATDDISGVHYQIVKLAVGALDTANLIAGDTANGIDVDVTRVTGNVTVVATDLDVRDLTATDEVSVLQGTGELRDTSGNATLTAKVKAALVATSGTNVFIAAVASKRIRVLGYRIQARGTVIVKFYDTDTVAAQITDSPEYSLQAREGVVATAYPGTFEFQSAVGMGVQIWLDGGVSTMVSVQYVEV